MRLRQVTMALLALVAAGPACLRAQSTERRVLRGVVQSVEGPIAKATVKLFHARDSERTDGNGAFALGGLTDGLHVFEVAAVGYRPQMVTVAVSDSMGPIVVTLVRGVVTLDSMRTVARSAGGASVPVSVASRKRDRVGEEELAQPDIIGGNALDAFAKLRPMLFHGRGAGGAGPPEGAKRGEAFERDVKTRTGEPTCIGNQACDVDSHLTVSINEGPLGSPDVLVFIGARSVREMRYLLPADATARFGLNAGNGPVLIVYLR
jgi:hypothetical protein